MGYWWLFYLMTVWLGPCTCISDRQMERLQRSWIHFISSLQLRPSWGSVINMQFRRQLCKFDTGWQDNMPVQVTISICSSLCKYLHPPWEKRCLWEARVYLFPRLRVWRTKSPALAYKSSCNISHNWRRLVKTCQMATDANDPSFPDTLIDGFPSRRNNSFLISQVGF